MDNIIIDEQGLEKLNCIFRHKEDGKSKQRMLQSFADFFNMVNSVGTIKIIDNQLVWEK